MSKKEVLKKMLLRKPFYPSQYLHPDARKVQNEMTKPLEPLTYKLKDLPDKLENLTEPLGPNPDLPFFVSSINSKDIKVSNLLSCRWLERILETSLFIESTVTAER